MCVCYRGAPFAGLTGSIFPHSCNAIWTLRSDFDDKIPGGGAAASIVLPRGSRRAGLPSAQQDTGIKGGVTPIAEPADQVF